MARKKKKMGETADEKEKKQMSNERAEETKKRGWSGH